MAMHARSGGQIEVMGLLQGRAEADGTFVVLDCFALPVEGTETRVNAQAEAYEYMVAFVDASRRAGKGATHNVVGWYHSHPGYGCWLSGIDVGTQMLNQTYQEPWLAVVVDPVRTMASGKVEVRGSLLGGVFWGARCAGSALWGLSLLAVVVVARERAPRTAPSLVSLLFSLALFRLTIQTPPP